MQPRADETDSPGQGQPAFQDNLARTLAEAWRLWEEGARDRRSAFHAPMLATVDGEGRPRARTVILRACTPHARLLRFNTDRRSDKYGELLARPAFALTGYDAVAKIQIRLEGRASVHADDSVADEAWAAARRMSKVCYGQTPGPGTSLDAGDAYALPESDAEIAGGRANFATVQLQVERLDWVYLAMGANRRALFRFTPAGDQAGWLAP